MGETLDRVRQSVEGAVQDTLRQRGHKETVRLVLYKMPNVFTWEAGDLDIRFALHVATCPEMTDLPQRFIKSTTDDYILSLALKNQTTKNLLADAGLDAVDSNEVIRKVQEEIPNLLRRNGIQLREAKDYIRIYLAVMGLGMSPTVFASKLLSHANRGEVEKVFAALVAALRFITGEDIE